MVRQHCITRTVGNPAPRHGGPRVLHRLIRFAVKIAARVSTEKEPNLAAVQYWWTRGEKEGRGGGALLMQEAEHVAAKFASQLTENTLYLDHQPVNFI
jgi:hypothetical protein